MLSRPLARAEHKLEMLIKGPGGCPAAEGGEDGHEPVVWAHEVHQGVRGALAQPVARHSLRGNACGPVPQPL
eukprot:2207907-Lingulodinium_polyedra.AAC.1